MFNGRRGQLGVTVFEKLILGLGYPSSGLIHFAEPDHLQRLVHVLLALLLPIWQSLASL